jgi:lipopolysaccharide export system protein LptA
VNRLLLLLLLFIFFSQKPALTRDSGETEITTEDGIEVFQKEKYYLLKKNVEILSDELELYGQIVKIYFEEGLYDIIELIANENVSFTSKQYNIDGKGDRVQFNIKNQKIFITGSKSELYLENTKMFSDGKITVDNLNGSFLIRGPNSTLISDNINITGSKINGSFHIIDGKRDIADLIVEDEKKLNIKTDNIIMFSKKAVYNKKKSTIELFEDVEINRNNEIITGDYGILDTKKNSYKVSSNNSNKVKAIILGSDE